MTLPEQGAKVALSTLDALKGQPMLLVMVILNIIFIGISAFLLREQRAQQATEWHVIVDRCIPGRDKN